jgi:hypothetical protein
MTIITECPPLSMKFDPHLLSRPTFGFTTDYLLKISAFLKKKIDSAEFRKFPATIQKLKQQHQEIMELYEWAKIKEKESKGKAFIKANAPFYRPRLIKKDDNRLFERLDKRRASSNKDGANNAIPEV